MKENTNRKKYCKQCKKKHPVSEFYKTYYINKKGEKVVKYPAYCREETRRLKRKADAKKRGEDHEAEEAKKKREEKERRELIDLIFNRKSEGINLANVIAAKELAREKYQERIRKECMSF